MSRRTVAAFVLATLFVVLPARAQASTTGGASYPTSSSWSAAAAQAPAASATAPASTTAPATTVTPVATVGADGLAVAPAGAPAQVVALIAAGNAIASLPYKYGGGHESFEDRAYDCSGSVSFALHGAGLLDATLDSTGLARWGQAGPGAWITIYANKTHTYLIVAGLRFDTSGQKKAGSRWQAAPRSSRGFKVRHPAGL
jgi:cell wall-associated NlpC family hydrolase